MTNSATPVSSPSSEIPNAPKRALVAPNLYLYRDGSYRDNRFWPSLGKYKMTTLRASNLTEAKREQRALAVKIDSGDVAEPSKRTFRDIADEFLAAFESQVEAGERSERTLDSYRQRLNSHLYPALGWREAQKINVNLVGELIADWRKAGMSPWTIKSALVPLGRIYSFAIRRGYVTENPCLKLERGEKPRISRDEEQRILSHEDIGKLIEAAPDAYRPLISTAIFTGLRMQELLGLRWEDVDFEAGLIRLRHQLSRATRQRPARLVALKTGAGRRDVILLPQLAALLKRHKLASKFSADSEYVFTTSAGTPLYYRNVSARGLDKAADSVGLNPDGKPKLGMHDLRHTFVSYLILELRFDPVRVARQVGHAKPSFTLDVYSHLFEQAGHAEDLRARMEASAFGKVLDGVDAR